MEAENFKLQKKTKAQIPKIIIIMIFNYFQNMSEVLASVGQLIGCHPVHQEVASSIPEQNTYWGFDPDRGVQRQPMNVAL